MRRSAQTSSAMANDQLGSRARAIDSLHEIDIRLQLGADVQVVALRMPGPEHVLGVIGHLVSESLASAVPKRRAEFALARHAAAVALARYGVTAVVPRNSDGSPAWPPGFVGSISHGGNIAVAAVASARSHLGIGIDVEPIVSAKVLEELAPRVLAQSERELLAALLPDATEPARFSLGFSAKESLFKCLYPLCQEFFEFEDARLVRLARDGAHSGDVELVLERTLAGGFAVGFSVSGRFVLDRERVATALALQRR
jgi:enterobactin synthetase component D